MVKKLTNELAEVDLPDQTVLSQQDSERQRLVGCGLQRPCFGRKACEAFDGVV